MMRKQITIDSPTHPVNLRVRDDVRALIDRAAQAYGKTRSDFMIEAAKRAAEDALLDQTLIRLDRPAYDHFLSVLDQPPCGAGFDRLMNIQKPWV